MATTTKTLPPRLVDFLPPPSAALRTPYWDAQGRCHWLDAPPGQVLEEWQAGEHVGAESRDFLDHIEMLLCGHITAATLRRQRACQQMLEVVLDGGESWYVRRTLRRQEHDPEADLVSERLLREANLLLWLRHHSTIPVPFVVRATPEFSVLRRMPGKTVRECWGRFDRQQKETVIISYAQYVTDTFDLNVPEVVGSTCGGTNGAGQIIWPAPFMGRGPAKLAPMVYSSVQELIDYVFSAALAEACATAPNEAVQEDREQLLGILHRAANASTCVVPPGACSTLAHDGADDGDIIVHEHTGEVTGVIDWEYHALVPRVLAACYPSWLRYDGVHDPRTARPGRWWLAPRDEALEMLALFEEVVKSKSQSYYDALREGAGLRSILEWVYEMGTEDYWARLRHWMVARRMLPQDEKAPGVKKQKSTMFTS